MEWECEVCFEDLDLQERRPKALPCGHTVCLFCVKRLDPDPSRCPLCREVIHVRLDQLKDNFYVVSRIEQTRGVSNKKTAASFRGCFWCNDCQRVATAGCVKDHTLRNLKKARLQELHPFLEILQSSREVLGNLRHVVSEAANEEPDQIAGCSALLGEHEKVVNDALQQIDAAIETENPEFERAKAAVSKALLAKPASQQFPSPDLPMDATKFLRVLGDPSCECSVTVQTVAREQAGQAVEPAWRGAVRLGDDAQARLLVCRLLVAGELQPDNPPVQVQEHDEDGEEERESVVVSCEAPRWLERSNQVVPSLEEMSTRIKVGSRVIRGRDWKQEWRGRDGTPPGRGTVTGVNNGLVDVQWDCSGNVVFGYYMGYQSTGQYHLELLPPAAPQVPLPSGTRNSNAQFFDALSLSSGLDIMAKTSLLTGNKLREVRVLWKLRCDVSPSWSRQVLQRVAPHLEALCLLEADPAHLHLAHDMPRLRHLYLPGKGDAQLLQLALSVSRLTHLEVHCPLGSLSPLGTPDAPVKLEECEDGEGVQGGQGSLLLPGAASLRWLRTGAHPLAVTLALARAHAATLQELQLVAATREPYGCPNLALELQSAGLRALRRLVLLRGRGMTFYQHDDDACRQQKLELWNMFVDMRLTVVVLCNECDRKDCEELFEWSGRVRL